MAIPLRPILTKISPLSSRSYIHGLDGPRVSANTCETEDAGKGSKMHFIQKGLCTLPIIFLLSGCQSLFQGDVTNLPPTAAVPETSVPGEVQAKYFDNIPGKRIVDLEGSPKFPDNPDEVLSLSSIAQSTSRGDNYGTLVNGFIIPPIDGQYRFFVSGDDQTELWLSSSSLASAINLIASVPGSSPREVYDRYSSQQSGLIDLKGGNRYYFELKHKEGTGGDHFSVAWEGPSLSQQIIGPDYLASYAAPLYPADEKSIEGFRLGYRIGYFDGAQGLPPSDNYPPLDSDNDGLYDNWEVQNGLNPANSADADSDPDSDLLTATDEFWLMTQEGNADTDGDGMPDGFEYAFGLNPTDASDAQADLDGDGFTNLEEFNSNTDPTDPGSLPEPISATVPGVFAHYFTGKNFESLAGTRAETSIDYRWGYGAPIPELPTDGFSARWIAFFTPPAGTGTRTYRFEATSDDGIRVRLGGQEILNGWWDHGSATFTGTAQLADTETQPLTVEFYENGGGAIAQLKIIDETTGQSLSPEAVLSYPDPSNVSTQDTDLDGIPDWWEVRYGTLPWEDDASRVYNNSNITVLDAYQSKISPWTLQSITDISYDPTISEQPVTTAPSDTTGGSITVSWTAPLTRTDGEPLSLGDISRYEIAYGTVKDALTESVITEGPDTTYTFTGLASGTWYFAVRAFDQAGVASVYSEPVSGIVP